MNKFLAALLPLVITILAALAALTDDQINLYTILQLVALAIGTGATLFLPLLDVKWQGVLKTGSAVLLAALAALLPFIAQGGTLDRQQIILVILAGLNAIASEIGVQVRLDNARTIVDGRATGTITTLAPDPAAERIVERQLMGGGA